MLFEQTCTLFNTGFLKLAASVTIYPFECGHTPAQRQEPQGAQIAAHLQAKMGELCACHVLQLGVTDAAELQNQGLHTKEQLQQCTELCWIEASKLAQGDACSAAAA